MFLPKAKLKMKLNLPYFLECNWMLLNNWEIDWAVTTEESKVLSLITLVGWLGDFDSAKVMASFVGKLLLQFLVQNKRMVFREHTQKCNFFYFSYRLKLLNLYFTKIQVNLKPMISFFNRNDSVDCYELVGKRDD